MIINRMPFIITVLKQCSSAELKKLYNLINGQGEEEEVFRTLYPNQANTLTTLDAEKGVKEISLELNTEVAQKLMYGYLIYPEEGNCCVLISFASIKSKNLILVEMDLAHYALTGNWRFIIHDDEILSVTDLRSELNAMLVASGSLIKVQANDVDSEEQPQGKVLMSDGNGGADWGEIEVPEETQLSDFVAPEYDETSTYSVGDLAVYENELYECTTAIVSGEAFDTNKWTRTTIADSILGLINTGL